MKFSEWSEKAKARMFKIHLTNFRHGMRYGMSSGMPEYLIKKYHIKFDENRRGTFEYDGTLLLLFKDGDLWKIQRADDPI